MAENNFDETVDPYVYIWLDKAIESSPKSRELKKRIQQLVKGRLQTFIEPDECVDYLTDIITTQKVFFIVSNAFGSLIVPFIHDAPQLETVYIYCGNRKVAEEWSTTCAKVRGIFVKEPSLLQQIRDNVGTSNDDEIFSMSVLQPEQQSLQKISEQQCTKFLWYQAVLTVLLHMVKYLNAKDDMIKAAREHYKNDPIEQKKIDEFEKTYTPEKAFRWYTLDSFVYRMLNDALRKQNIDMIFKFRFFTNDLHKQIQKLYQQDLTKHKGEELRFYRGQQMSMNEIEVLKKCKDGLISLNSFLSTTRILEVAKLFVGADGPYDAGSSLQAVLFIIDVCDIDQDTTAFAFIKRYACNEDEDEVLFTISAVFKVVLVEPDGNTWRVHLKLSKQQQNQQHQEFSDYMMKQLGSEPSLVSLGWFLYRKGGSEGFNDAIRYAEYILNQSNIEDKDKADANNLLGLIYKDLKNPKQSVVYYEKALEICRNSHSIGNSQIFGIHYNASLAYLAMNDTDRADAHRQKAASLLTNSSNNNQSLLIAMTESLNAKLQAANGDYPTAFKRLEVALEEKKKKLSAKHPSYASTLNDMGIMQEKMGNDKKALEYFERALDMWCDCLTTNHLDFVECHTNLGRMYYKEEKYESALEQFDAAYKIMIDYRLNETENFKVLMRCLSDTHDHVFGRRLIE